MTGDVSFRLSDRENAGSARRADAGRRPFFHPSDAGLPVVSLLEWYEFAANQQKTILNAVERSLRFELTVTKEVNNPFGYARQLVRMEIQLAPDAR